jgi:hypothetical protein
VKDLAVDHVLIAAGDLDETARWLLETHGLVALPGGRHPGRGTANMIVPLGDSYLELITVVDEQEAAAGRHHDVLDALRNGWRFAGWAVRTADIDAAARELTAAGIPVDGPHDGSRQRPDGHLLRWRTLHNAIDDAGHPFLIQWAVAPGDYPGAMAVEHPAGKPVLQRVEIHSPDPDSFKSVLGDDLPYEVIRDSDSRVVRVELSTGVIE